MLLETKRRKTLKKLIWINFHQPNRLRMFNRGLGECSIIQS
jgi:hypothetical protein